MNYKTIKGIEKQIKETRASLARERATIDSIVTKSDGQPRQKNNKQSRVENKTVKIITLENKLAELDEEYNATVASVPSCYEGDIIKLKLAGRTWRQIAYATTGNGNNRDAIRKAASRYEW